MSAMPAEERRERYGAAVLAALLAEVSSAGPGQRNGTLVRAAYRAGRIVAGGALAEEAAEALLIDAGQSAGLSLAEARTTVRSGLRAGHRAGPTGPADIEAPAVLRRRIEPEKTPPPAAGVTDLWGRSLPVYDDPPLAAELSGRGLDPAAITDADLSRTLPPAALPRWARSQGGTWADTGHRLLLGLHDASGALRSIHARTLRRRLPEGLAKGLSPAGFSLRGLVLADATARSLLSGDSAPRGWSGELWLVEGCPDFLAAATHHSDAATERPAVIGYLGGSWTKEHAQRVGAGVEVVMWPHADEAGQKMAARIAATLTHARVFYAQIESVHHG